MQKNINQHTGSFRDPDGFIFFKDDFLYRRVNLSAKDAYDRLMQSGLYHKLVDAGQMVPHQEMDGINWAHPNVYRTLRPQKIPFITYSYEWCFSQFKDAALLTLSIQRQALDHGLSLKDASSYNIQFIGTKPILIDTLSFDIVNEGAPWAAYRQFCQHFLAPLALMAFTDVRLSQLLRVYLDGIPLDLASRLLPIHTRFNSGILTHIHLHALAQKRTSTNAAPVKGSVSRNALMGLLENLEQTVKSLRWKPSGTEWSDYYSQTNYSTSAFKEKSDIVTRMLKAAQPASVWDLGANTGFFSRLSSQMGIDTVAMDVDPGAVELNYLQGHQNQELNLLPMIVDLTNPGPSLGWANQERQSLLERGRPDCLLVLALIHHLAISNNLPFTMLASFFSSLARWLIIEFVPKEDSQAQKLLASRKDIFSNYTMVHFMEVFQEYYIIHASEQVPGSARKIFLLERKTDEIR